MPKDVQTPEMEPRCLACGKIHGGVMALIHCLENEIKKLRLILKTGRRLGHIIHSGETSQDD